MSEYELAHHESAKEAIAAISKYISTEEAQNSHLDQTAAYNLIIMYRSRLERERHGRNGVQNVEDLKIELTAIPSPNGLRLSLKFPKINTSHIE